MKTKMLCACLMIFCIQAFSQDHFEVLTKRAYPGPETTFSSDSALTASIPDTASMYAMFVIEIDPPSSVDSLALTLTNSQNQEVYSEGSSMTALQSQPSFTASGNIFYYKVGPYPYLQSFSATALLRNTNGQFAPIRSFTKN